MVCGLISFPGLIIWVELEYDTFGCPTADCHYAIQTIKSNSRRLTNHSENTQLKLPLTDYLHLTKALGHVALSQLPFQVLMSPASYISTSRPISPSIASAVTSIPQPALSAYHRLFGRVVLSPLLLGHAVLYAGFFIQSSHPDFSSLLAKRVQDPDVQWGIGGIIAAISLLLLTRPTGPRRGLQVWATSSIKTRRQVFYVVHVVLVGALCLAAYCHVAQAQSFVMQTLGSFVINGAWCWVMMR
ncbi:hypothetical protein ASPWEDRAFT_37229 [Aspergillus wentii DTO 134E9]|uniref:Ferric oxidoreductase domain-containing protein n=1 Tax=Aspergillus wentii DTO 134E9 TaxID=1073089 RepID=A0A1L9RWZ2_ASPWE|nr:uncharacterized protein ASPWEDRAFT_37229 [Aspergillus wentii DTO 134E9]OJJ39446.1 hypothetical protein ASPWEDRAFT_37229 [Aspergillus wentii DTO 134E9]